MTQVRRFRSGITLAFATAGVGLVTAALAGSPVACADNPYTDIVSDIQNSITIGDADYSAAVNDFSTAGGTNAGLVAEFVGFDNTFVSSTDYAIGGLVAAATNTDFASYDGIFRLTPSAFPLSVAGEQSQAAADMGQATTFFQESASAFTNGDYFDATIYDLAGVYKDILAGQADTLAELFGVGI